MVQKTSSKASDKQNVKILAEETKTLPESAKVLQKSTSEKISSALDILAKLFGLLTWQVVVLLIIFMFYSPIKQLVEMVPDKFQKSNEITVGGILSLKIQEQAKATGNEELATALKGLSPEAIEWILKLGDGSHRVIASDDARTGVVANYSLPTHINVWKELAARGLLESTVDLEEYEKFFYSLNPILDGTLPEIPASSLTKWQEDKLLNNSVRLSDAGKSAYEIITSVIGELISQE